MLMLFLCHPSHKSVFVRNRYIYIHRMLHVCVYMYIYVYVCAGFYPSTFIYSCFSPKIEFLDCLLSHYFREMPPWWEKMKFGSPDR